MRSQLASTTQDLSQWGASFICKYFFLGNLWIYFFWKFVNIFFENLSIYFFENLSIYFFVKICPYIFLKICQNFFLWKFVHIWQIFNFVHLGCQNSLPTQECQGTTTTYLPTFRHQPMRSQLASQPANEEPALFVHIFFWEICSYNYKPHNSHSGDC